ncbi:hypothetical protein Ddye_026603 [Dipteronia dyeriana]|uniref:Transposase n=1 Tax=Dipteronia dyeriana TaxID=168575 RepID=A0AAD9WQM2_9ROSI|nr:hypothetical protein Ddye_026603 [Dipteronia dyeriana]
MRQNFEWKIKRSNKTTLHLVCLMDNCTWTLRAVIRDDGPYFQVTSFVNEHTSLLKEIHYHHRQASAVIIGEVVAPRLHQHDGRLMRPKDIIADMKTVYDIQILYSKVSYLEDFGGVCVLVIIVDGTYLKEDSGVQCLFLLNNMGTNRCIKLILVFLDVTYTICCWHFTENMKKQFHRKDVAVIMDKTARSYTELKYNLHMEELRNLHQNVYDCANDAGPHKWSSVHCLDRRVVPVDIAEHVVLNPLSGGKQEVPGGVTCFVFEEDNHSIV